MSQIEEKNVRICSKSRGKTGELLNFSSGLVPFHERTKRSKHDVIQADR